MEAAEPHIKRGCWCDPWPLDQMYMNTRRQPITGLQERLHLGDSGRNEVRHRVFNQLVEHVSRIGEDLMDADLDFAVFFSNRNYDELFGRVDPNSLSIFPWSDADLNSEAAEILEGPPLFPRALSSERPLPKLEPIEEGHAHWEPIGFEYLRYLKDQKDDAVVAAALEAGARLAATADSEDTAREMLCQEIAGDESMDADEAELLPPRRPSPPQRPRSTRSRGSVDAHAALSPPAAAPSPSGDVEVDSPSPTPMGSNSPADTAVPVTPATWSPRSLEAISQRQGSAHWSGKSKARAETLSRSKEVEPTSEAERALMVQAMTEAQREFKGATKAMYERTAELYLEKLTLALSSKTVAPPAQLRPNRTNATLVKAVAERCVRHAHRIALERDRGGSSSDAAAQVDDGGEASAAIASLIMPLAAAPPMTMVEAAAQDAAAEATLAAPAPQPRIVGKKRRAPSTGATRHTKHNDKKRGASLNVRYDQISSLNSRDLPRIINSGQLTKKVEVYYSKDGEEGGKRKRRPKDIIVEDVRAAWPAGLAVMVVDACEVAVAGEDAEGGA